MDTSFTVYYIQKRVFPKLLLKNFCTGNLCVSSQHDMKEGHSAWTQAKSVPQAKPLLRLHWLENDEPPCKYPNGAREIAAATFVTCRLCPMILQLRHFHIYRLQECIQVPFLKHLVASILALTDDPKTWGCAATLLVIWVTSLHLCCLWNSGKTKCDKSWLMFIQPRDSCSSVTLMFLSFWI